MVPRTSKPDDIPEEKAELKIKKRVKQVKFKKTRMVDGINRGRWTDEEIQIFFEGFKKYGKNYKEVEKLIQTRTQC